MTFLLVDESRDGQPATDSKCRMILFFRENNGDFLAIDTATRSYYLATFGRDEYEGRATAIAGLIGSVCTTGISRDFLKANCRRVARTKVPADWSNAIGM